MAKYTFCSAEKSNSTDGNSNFKIFDLFIALKCQEVCDLHDSSPYLSYNQALSNGSVLYSNISYEDWLVGARLVGFIELNGTTFMRTSRGCQHCYEMWTNDILCSVTQQLMTMLRLLNSLVCAV